jgi:hypothetical protein
MSKYKVNTNICGAKCKEVQKGGKFCGNTDEECILTSLPNWIITDTRFPNEFQAVKDRGGISIKVTRDLNSINGQCITKCNQYPNCKPCGDIKPQHESETALDNVEFDYVIDNNGTIENLIEKVSTVLKKEKLI